MEFISRIADWLCSESAAHLGEFLTGLAAILALLAAIRTVPRELKKWRHQERIKRRTETAGKMAVATLRFAEALRHITNPIALGAPEKIVDQVTASRVDFYKRVDESNNDFTAFLTAWSESEVYLPKEINDKLDELWKHWIGIRASFETWYACLKNGADASNTVDYHTKVYGAEPKKRLAEIETSLKELLIPIAQMTENE